MYNLRIKLPINQSLPKLVPLIFPFVVLALSDSILSYAAPIYAQRLFSNDFLIGLALSFSSFVGLVFDYVSKRVFGSKNFAFFIKATFVMSIAFSYFLGLSFINKYFFIFAMAAWGIYYETIAFSSFKYLKTNIELRNYTFSWSFINVVRALAYTVGPLISTLLISQHLQLPTYLCGTFVLAAFFLYLIVFQKDTATKTQGRQPAESRTELKTWLVLFKRIYPLWLLNLMLAIVDSGFWTVGILMSENLRKTFPQAVLFIPLYMLPAVLFSPLSQTFSAKFGKKRTAIVTSLIGSLALVSMGLIIRIEFILLAVFLYSVFTSISFPAIYACFEDYTKRLGDFDTDLIGLEQSSSSTAYLIGPILAGLVAVYFTEQKVFFVFGVLLGIVALAALIVTPRKIRMPQSELLKLA
jgi:MFS family permease